MISKGIHSHLITRITNEKPDEQNSESVMILVAR
jgi:hypothetical protein